jgi:hypothetical protein
MKGTPVTVLLITAAAVAVYILFALARPATGCRKCRGFGFGTRRRRRRSCPRCGGTGTRFRPGAPALYRSVSGYRRHRATGTLTRPPIRSPRPADHDSTRDRR